MTGEAIAVFGGGCFWCTEAIFASLKGVKAVMPGYTGGTTENPTYDQVSGGRTGHVESIEIRFDPAVVSFNDLLTVFFNTHDPTTLNRQGNDVGTQYQSAIFYATPEQKAEAEAFVKELNDTHAYDKAVVTDIKPLGVFYPAETYHRDYYKNHTTDPYCQIIIQPKIEKLQRKFAELVKTE